MYHFDGNFIVKDNELFSVDTVDITFPVLENSIDTAYTFIYFHDDTIRALKRKILILASNYSTDSMLLYCDLNNNLDLTDDGAPLVLDSVNGEVSIPLESPYYENAFHYFVLYFPKSKSQKSIDYLENLFKHYGRSRRKISARYWFDTQVKNIIATDVEVGTDSFRIAIIDNNQNSIFNEFGKDKLVVTGWRNKKVPSYFFEGVLLQKNGLRFSSQNNGFELDTVTPDGRYVKFHKISIDSIPRKLRIGDKIPDFKYLSLKGDSVSIYDFIEPGEKTYLEFMYIGCSGCMFLLPFIEDIYEKHSDKIKVLSLNTMQGLAQTKDFIKERDLKSPYGVVSKNVWRTLYGEYSPWGVLLDEEGNIEEFGIWGNELLEELDKE
jgi:thiol-disulfide isomerase/thioredoxin